LILDLNYFLINSGRILYRFVGPQLVQIK